MTQLLPMSTVLAIDAALTSEEKMLLHALADGPQEHHDRIPERVLIATGLAEPLWDGEHRRWLLALTTFGALAEPGIMVPVEIAIEVRT